MKTAVIDIGSNSVRLMLWADGKSLYKKIATTRLGEGIALFPRLNEEAMARTADAVALFQAEGAAAGAAVYAFATAAVRSAENGGEFCALVKRKCGLDVDVVSGEEEAKLGLCGALGNGEGGIVDIGGASAEIAYRKGNSEFFTSIPMGAVRLFDLCGDDPAAVEERIGPLLVPLRRVSVAGTVYAIGGTASTLASVKLGLTAYDKDCMNDVALPLPWVRSEAQTFFKMSAEERKAVKGMDVRRADIIAGATALLAAIMETLRLREVRFSDRDNLEGYLVRRGLA